jgi:hypothetical protein
MEAWRPRTQNVSPPRLQESIEAQRKEWSYVEIDTRIILTRDPDITFPVESVTCDRWTRLAFDRLTQFDVSCHFLFILYQHLPEVKYYCG